MTVVACLALATAHYDRLQRIGQEPDFYTLGAQLDRVWTALRRSVLEQSLGPANPQKT